MTEYKLQTPGFDARFPQQNQTKHCYQSYLDYHKCVALKGSDFEPCKVFWHTFQSLCPHDWVENWDDEREKGIFPGDLSIDQFKDKTEEKKE
ncbi:Cytochrome c oxidase subunit 6B [Brettanomyces bruxellensis]|uniref:Cytochrome c oxidase subunit n=1 Tax=Dekkera bruxellensis TaxID=5007 RepID=A0A3F2Y341_DEKBR|nr:Cytochrome c oxidase subunit 6B [Brettanomyces bruxellensis]KAF6006673.1 Cytochrome c oxidase subunit 6B [Brettanomyces bruxellensis]KAF6009086.1 Cytochrome c oxidase subunit 6B [Brettanomyces bruxellensis]QOU18672.1 Cytochrome c oxidase subunit 6B [Brettanomyces bruxellensis]VUG17391.1 COX12 [Brettanomyces bruxellensis]